MMVSPAAMRVAAVINIPDSDDNVYNDDNAGCELMILMTMKMIDVTLMM